MTYTIIKEVINDNVLGTYETFGIKDENGDKISDISTDIKTVKKLLSEINKKQTPKNYICYEIERILSEI